MIITIGLCTYKRPNMLDNTIKSISKLSLPIDAKISLCIIDNDEKCSAQYVIEKWNKLLSMKIIYVVEKNLGIAYARNKALFIASKKKTDLMLFIDDDEIVEPSWLNAHIEYYKKNNVDVVLGPVESILPTQVPKWIVFGEFFKIKKLSENTICKDGATGNVLFNFNKLYHDYELRFNTTLKSREDNDFFMRASIKGAKILWTNTAIVYEDIPMSRLNTKWLIQRTYKSGEAYAKREVYRLGYFIGYMVLTLKIIYRVLKGILIFPLFFLGKYSYLVKSAQEFSIAMGIMGGVFGSNYDDYKFIHGK